MPAETVLRHAHAANVVTRPIISSVSGSGFMCIPYGFTDGRAGLAKLQHTIQRRNGVAGAGARVETGGQVNVHVG